MQRFLKCMMMTMVMMLALCAAAAAESGMVQVDTQQIPENRVYRSGYAVEPFEGKIVLSEIKGSKVSAKPWIAFYGRTIDGKSVKYALEFDDGNIQVYALYDGGTRKGLLDRKYLLHETLPARDKWQYSRSFTIEAVDGQAVITLGGQSYTWPGVTTLTGEMEVGRVSGKLEIYNYVRE